MIKETFRLGCTLMGQLFSLVFLPFKIVSYISHKTMEQVCYILHLVLETTSNVFQGIKSVLQGIVMRP
jgi:hypothetical protein